MNISDVITRYFSLCYEECSNMWGWGYILEGLVLGGFIRVESGGLVRTQTDDAYARRRRLF